MDLVDDPDSTYNECREAIQETQQYLESLRPSLGDLLVDKLKARDEAYYQDARRDLLRKQQEQRAAEQEAQDQDSVQEQETQGQGSTQQQDVQQQQPNVQSGKRQHEQEDFSPEKRSDLGDSNTQEQNYSAATQEQSSSGNTASPAVQYDYYRGNTCPISAQSNIGTHLDTNLESLL